MNNNKYIETSLTLTTLEAKARSGSVTDIDFLMENLFIEQTFVICKMIDHALGQVSSQAGRERIAHYLFNGSRIQRNYAALYFRRKGAQALVEEAYHLGCIDKVQAFAR